MSGNAETRFELVVVGSGSAGEAAAFAARAGGHTAAIIEKGRLGGECSNYACVPTKALLRSARVYRLLKKARDYGLRARETGFDWARVLARKDRIVGNAGAHSAAERYERAGIALFEGAAAFEDPHTLRVDGRVLHAERVMLATGSVPARPDIPGIEQVHVITSEVAVSLPQLPKRLAIVGGGPVGCEFAELFASFGVEVIVLEQAPALLEHEEPEVGQIVQQSLMMAGVTVLCRAQVARCERVHGRDMVRARVEGEPYDFFTDVVLLAAGRQAQIEGLNLPAAGVELDESGRVRVNEWLQTTQPHIFAGGDVAGPLLYTHLATYQGQLAGRNAFAREPERADYRVVPRVTFTDPEVASVGLREAEARASGRAVASGCFEVKTLGRALVDSTNVGVIKLVGDAHTGEILGGHIAAPCAGELIHEVVAAMQARAPVRDLAAAIHAYPTFAEGVRLAAGDWLERAEGRETKEGRHERTGADR